MRMEFEKLEQRPGTHTVPVKMTREELDEVAQKTSDLITSIEAREDTLKSYNKDAREEIGKLYERLSASNRAFRFAREPKDVDGLWGFDAIDHGQVKCRTCVERVEKGDNSDYATKAAAGAATEAELVTMHESADHPLLTSWTRPLGTKWFVDPTSGDVYGPVPITEKDLQRELPPELKEIEPFKLAFDSETVVPLLNEAEVSAAEAKLREGEMAEARERAAAEGETDLCPQCGLPETLHPTALEAGTDGQDACKAAMVAAADAERVAQEERTKKKYGSDDVLDPEATYPCAECGTATFGRDLSPVVLVKDGKPVGDEMVCFTCEQKLKDAPPAEPTKKKRSRKKKGGADAQA